MYTGAETINIEVPADWEMKEIDFSTLSYSPVRGQVQGSCWAEATTSVHELQWNSLVPGSKLVFAVDDVIRCSGYGTARSGGRLAFGYSKDGLAFEADWPYTGRDGACRKDVERHNPLLKIPFIRGATGEFPTERELNYALHVYGPIGVCGSAGALKNGGWHDELPSNGSTNHCYAEAAMRWGPNWGKAAVWFHGIKNSWGDGVKSVLNPGGRSWGDHGWGWYRLAKEAGGKILGSIITELQMGYAGERKPAEPVTFELVGKNLKLVVTVQPKSPSPVAKVKAKLAARLAKLDKVK